MMEVEKGLCFISEHQRRYEALSLLDTGRQQGESRPRQRSRRAQMSQDGREQKPSNVQLIYLSLPYATSMHVFWLFVSSCQSALSFSIFAK